LSFPAVISRDADPSLAEGLVHTEARIEVGLNIIKDRDDLFRLVSFSQESLPGVNQLYDSHNDWTR
jgi:hypothetical protein